MQGGWETIYHLLYLRLPWPSHGWGDCETIVHRSCVMAARCNGQHEADVDLHVGKCHHDEAAVEKPIFWNHTSKFAINPSNLISLRINLGLNTLATIFCWRDGLPVFLWFSPGIDFTPKNRGLHLATWAYDLIQLGTAPSLSLSLKLNVASGSKISNASW